MRKPNRNYFTYNLVVLQHFKLTVLVLEIWDRSVRSRFTFKQERVKSPRPLSSFQNAPFCVQLRHRLRFISLKIIREIYGNAAMTSVKRLLTWICFSAGMLLKEAFRYYMFRIDQLEVPGFDFLGFGNKRYVEWTD